MQELRPGLWTWTATHPAWETSRSKQEWGPDVRSYALDTGPCLVLFDPLAPPSLIEGLIEAQDVGVALTADWHRRGADECVERLGAHVFGLGEELPGGVQRMPTYYDEEWAFWLPKHHALVVGDAFLAERDFVLQEEWLPEGMTREQMVEGLRHLLDLPVELVLVTHGEPVVNDARELLRAALERPTI